MNRKEYLLLCLAEECAEVAQRVSKALRFTAEEVQPGNTYNNAERITKELVDLHAVTEMLVAEGVLTNPYIENADIEQKKQKVELYMKYSENLETVVL